MSFLQLLLEFGDTVHEPVLVFGGVAFLRANSKDRIDGPTDIRAGHSYPRRFYKVSVDAKIGHINVCFMDPQLFPDGVSQIVHDSADFVFEFGVRCLGQVLVEPVQRLLTGG